MIILRHTFFSHIEISNKLTQERLLPSLHVHDFRPRDAHRKEPLAGSGGNAKSTAGRSKGRRPRDGEKKKRLLRKGGNERERERKKRTISIENYGIRVVEERVLWRGSLETLGSTARRRRA